MTHLHDTPMTLFGPSTAGIVVMLNVVVGHVYCLIVVHTAEVVNNV